MKSYMMRALGALSALAVALMLALAFTPAKADAATVVRSGIWGTCPWELTDDGTLTVHPGTGVAGIVPWRSLGANVTAIVFAQEDGKKVFAPVNSSLLFYSLDSHLESIDFSGLDTSRAITMSGMFYNCGQLVSLDLSGFDTSNVRDMIYMFEGCESLNEITYGEGFVNPTASWTPPSGMWLAESDGLVRSGDSFVAGVPADTYHRVLAGGFWGTCPWEITLDGVLYVHPGTGETQDLKPSSPWQQYRDDILAIVFKRENGSKAIAPANMNLLFEDLWNVRTIDFTGLDTSNATSMKYLFYGCLELASIDFAGFDTSNVTDMSYMFYECPALTSIDVSGFDTSKVEDMSFMFFDCEALPSVDLSGFDTSSVTNMDEMFVACKSLGKLDLSGFDTAKVENMYAMFAFCEKLTSLDLSGFDTSSLTNLSKTFAFMSSLVWLDLSSWDTAQVVDMSGAFYECPALRSIAVGDGWTCEKVKLSAAMFEGCVSLVGGSGTAFDEAHTDASYARIDSASAPGYFSPKSDHAPGWAYENGAWRYYEGNGSMRRNAWAEYGGKYYYLGSDGRVVVSSWINYGNDWYYVGADGTPKVSSWLNYGGAWYWFGADGKLMLDGWVRYGSQWYHTDEYGRCMVNRWLLYEGTWYYFGPKGTITRIVSAA